VRAARLLLALPGLAALAYGALLAVRFVAHSGKDGRSALEFFVGGAIGHDLLVAPIVGLVALVISRWAPVAWRTPVRIGAAITAVLGLIALPTLWRANAGPANPGLDDRDYAGGLLAAYAVVWLLVVLGGLLRARHIRRDLRRSA
jgi:hypothetical protein